MNHRIVGKLFLALLFSGAMTLSLPLNAALSAI